jgi:hypothetical protein
MLKRPASTAGRIVHTTVVAIFSLCIGRTSSDLAVQCIACVCFNVERRKRVVCCLEKEKIEQAILL